ncbi:serine protease [bacterium]|nr:serine protease [bacterium]
MVGGSNPSARKLLLLTFLFVAPAYPDTESPIPGPVYILPIQGEIQKGLVYIVRRGVKDALAAHASALILDMSTPGGEGEAMKDIMSAIAKFQPSDRTYTYVNKEAFSAGAFISASTREIWMAPGAIIGAASPVTLGQEGPKELPPKFVSAYAAIIRSAAEQNGHNPAVFEAMVNKQTGLRMDGREIVAKGDILTLTTQEAMQVMGHPGKPLLAAGTSPSLEKLVQQKMGPNVKIVRVEPTGFESAGRFIVSLSPLLLGAAFLFGYLEFKTPGFGIFGVLAAVCGLIFFFGHYIAGLSGYENLILIGLGVGLIALEFLLFPGTLLPGLTGLALVLYALLNTMADRYPQDPILPTLSEIYFPLVKLSWGFFGGLAAIVLAARFLPETFLFRPFRLSVTSPPAPTPLSPALHVGARGKALMDLRPSGTARFGKQDLDVLAEGHFIPKGAVIRVHALEGSVVHVRSLSAKDRV